MKISWGWGLDGAPSAYAGAGQQILRIGPAQILELLRTRLGLSRPAGSLPLRVAQYRSLMEGSGHPWFHRSFATDPWNTARQVLALRDAAVVAGWEPADLSETELLPPRVEALSQIESRAVVGSTRDEDSNLLPGRSDDLRELLAQLRRLADSAGEGVVWPLGISCLEVMDDVAVLPYEWRELLDLLERCGVSVVAHEGTSESVPDSLAIVRGEDEWSTAESAARFLSSTAHHESLVIIAGDDTAVLDQQLRRRGMPTLGQPASSTDPACQLLPLFLSALVPPVDVHRVAEFLSFRVTVQRDSHQAEPRSAGIVPHAVRNALLGALVAEPGISGDDDSAWARALSALRAAAQTDDDRQAVSAWSIAQSLDGFLRTDPPTVADNSVDVDSITAAVGWLAQRVRALGGGEPTRFIDIATAHISTFLDTLRLIGSQTLLIRELFDIVEACAPRATTPASPAHAAPWTVVTNPAHVPPDTETVLWWSAHSAETSQPHMWDDDEAVALEAAGATITTAAQRERLVQAGSPRGLSQATNLIAFCPGVVGGAEHRLHPALVQIAERYAQHRPDVFGSPPPAVDDVLVHPAIAHPVTTQCDGERWSLGDQDLGVRAVVPERIVVPGQVSRIVDGDFTHLLPNRLSYSQIDRLLNSPLAWSLERGLSLSSGYGVQVPTGNRMIGTLVHAVVEHLVRTGAVADDAVPSAETIATTFKQFVPRFASELLLPGQSSRHNALLTTTIGSLTGLFTALRDRGVRITGAETEFIEPFTLTIGGARHDTELRGFRDLDGETTDGRRAVLDLKWTFSTTRYRRMVTDGEAVQLSVYGQVVGTSGGGEPPLTAFYMLKQGQFVSADRDLDPDSQAEGDPAHLWPRIQRSVEHALTGLSTGRFEALAADAYLETGTLLGGEKKPYKDAIAAIRDDADTDGRLFIDANQAYSGFTLIYGLTGDYS